MWEALYVRVGKCIRVCLYVSLCLYVHLAVHICVCVHVCARTCVCVCVCVCWRGSTVSIEQGPPLSPCSAQDWVFMVETFLIIFPP